MIPKNAKRIPLRPLALGEVTGHQHRLVSTGACAVEDACELYEHQGDGITTQHFLRVTEDGIALIHATEHSTETADHQPHVVAPGEYRVVIQEEVTDWGTQQVAD
jgi:hypothetical protein